MAGRNDNLHSLVTDTKQDLLSDVLPDELAFLPMMRYPADSLFSQALVTPSKINLLSVSPKKPKIVIPASQISLFSFFSGVGFLDLGFEFEGFNISYVNEVRKPFLDAYRYSRRPLNFHESEYGYYEGSVSDFIEDDKNRRLREIIRDSRRKKSIVGFIGGPPCPDFSVGGKNRGSEGDHGKLSSIYIELICQQRPDFYVFENVKGLWSTKKHKAFYEEIKRKTHLAGYVTTERLVNSIEYGVPQDRDRVILIGFQRSLLADVGIEISDESNVVLDKIFPWEKFIKYPKKDAFTYSWPTTNPFAEDSDYPYTNLVPEELTVERWFKENDVLNHANSEHYFKPRAGLTRFASVAEGDDSKKSFKRLHRWRYSPTACYGNNEVHLHPYKIRRISAAEAMAIQSLPKNFTLPPSMTLTDMFKSIGNGVPFVLARAIALMIKDFLGETYS